MTAAINLPTFPEFELQPSNTKCGLCGGVTRIKETAWIKENDA